MAKNIPNVGESAPYFTVTTARNSSFSLKSTLAKGRNVMLVFYRGHW